MTDYFSIKKSIEREREISSLLGRDILKGESMRRLQGVSFLGVLNAIAGVPEHLRFSRYDHSISVAFLTWNYCENLKLPKEISLTATLLALIHDVSHPPFSHSTEIFLGIKSGVHTTHTSSLPESRIVKVLKEGYDSFPTILQKKSLDGLGKNLYVLFSKEERENYHPYIANILDTPFCPDTFDGVNRAWYALNTEEVRRKLGASGNAYFEDIEPMALISFISSKSVHPFVYKSQHPPTEANLILRFHNLMRGLYDDVIYSHWQSSAMVMFARTLEIAYADINKIDYSRKNDQSFIKKIEKNDESRKLYHMIIEGRGFSALSEENSSLYKLALDTYEQRKRQNKSYVKIKKAIETLVANKLRIKTQAVFCHIFNPLIWSRENVWFKEISFKTQTEKESLWLLKWDTTEGELDSRPRIEVYYTTSLD